MIRHTAKLLVTGASGFLGQAVMARAAAWELEAIAVSRDVFHPGNVTDFAALLDRKRPDYAIDSAGVLPGGGDVADNIALTQTWITALGLASARPRLVLTGSAAIYGRGAAISRATREDDPKQPTSDYGRAKLAAMELGQQAHVQDGHDIQTGIVFNLIGAGQPAHMAPEVFIRKALAARGGKLEVGPVDSVRDFMHVEDAADALIAMALHGAPGEVLNVATGCPTRICDLLDRIAGALGASWVSRDQSGPEEAADICYGDPAHLMARTGWQPRHNLETALERAIQATQSHRKASTTI
ncbi:NAD-dependent epimerase/dehydratase family protein [Roseovarius sp.]|uniref:NAD-dependent epimerase/dehydratase family protein n=1 Tax=Roseovarius sp. TaxID=1486281 RepID=UPI003D0CD2CF